MITPRGSFVQSVMMEERNDRSVFERNKREGAVLGTLLLTTDETSFCARVTVNEDLRVSRVSVINITIKQQIIFIAA